MVTVNRAYIIDTVKINLTCKILEFSFNVLCNFLRSFLLGEFMKGKGNSSSKGHY